MATLGISARDNALPSSAMLPITHTQPKDDAKPLVPAATSEFNDVEYIREVLQLEEGKTEAILDNDLTALAEELGITVAQPVNMKGAANPAHSSVCDSSTTFTTNHARTASTGSRASTSTGITSRSSNEGLNGHAHMRRSLSFTDYDKFIEGIEAQALLSGAMVPPPIPTESAAPSMFSVSTRKSYQSIKSTLKQRFRLKRNKLPMEDSKVCICCRDDFKGMSLIRKLPCGHNYCDTCIRVLITQASTDETKMPPRCCTRPLPAQIVKLVLSREDQQIFMKSVLRFSTPWEERVFCPNTTCGEFIPKRNKIDPKHPFEVVCRQCDTRVCSSCKRAAHPFGQDCSMDWDMETVLELGGKPGWKKCYKCKSLVEIAEGGNHATCECDAEFCNICGAIWDSTIGCPNYCSGTEELERRREEEAARAAEVEADKVVKEEVERLEACEKVEAERRTAESEELNEIRERQLEERDRFCTFERKMKWLMWTRHGQAKIDVLDKYSDMQLKMRERHAKTATHLEDRQVGAEMELRASLQQSEKSVKIRLRHMEAYCDGLGRTSNGPPRVVTERDLRELGQQYNVRDDLERLHQSKINVMRDKQAKQMEQLLSRQQEEEDAMQAKQDAELDAVEETFASEEEEFLQLFNARKDRLLRRWEIISEAERKKLESAKGVRFAPLAAPEWPVVIEKKDSTLESVTE